VGYCCVVGQPRHLELQLSLLFAQQTFTWVAALYGVCISTTGSQPLDCTINYDVDIRSLIMTHNTSAYNIMVLQQHHSSCRTVVRLHAQVHRVWD
jgi:hypothetical protein